jgi:xanthine dehydrogenase accessory factor
MNGLVWIKGGGDLATGVAYRLYRAGFWVLITELPAPICVRRLVSFAEAVHDGRHTVEGVTAVRVAPDGALAALVRTVLNRGEIPVLVDPTGAAARSLKPVVLIDAIMAKRNTGTSLADAPVVLALGPGFTAGEDCHAVIETQRGHYLGRAIYQGAALPDTGIPGEVSGVAGPRVLRSPASGVFQGLVSIGQPVSAGDLVGHVQTSSGDHSVVTSIGGILRGLVRSGTTTPEGIKIGDVDPTGEVDRCHSISDKALSIGGGALEALLRCGTYDLR